MDHINQRTFDHNKVRDGEERCRSDDDMLVLAFTPIVVTLILYSWLVLSGCEHPKRVDEEVLAEAAALQAGRCLVSVSDVSLM